MNEAELRRAGRGSGMRTDVLPSLEQVERRRFELWLMSTVLLVGLTAGLAILSLWSPEDMHDLLARPAVRFGLVGMSLVLSAYSVEKEVSLRRVSRLLVDERLLTTALSSRLHEISTLLDAGRAVNSTLELDRVLSSILSGATDLLPATRGSVMLLDAGELVVAAAVGNDTALGQRQALGDGIAGHVARTREPLLIDGTATPSLFPGLGTRLATTRSALCVPLLERGELLGVLSLSSPGRGDFTEYDLRAVSLFAEQAAAAIGKARLYERSREQAAQLAHAAHHDALTGLANRTALHARAAEGDGRHALLFLDLDGFKQVNDELGHQAGDAVLVAVAGRLRGCLAERDLVARFGGDEFAILLAGVSEPRVATDAAERVLATLAASIVVDGHRIVVTASVGVALPADGEHLDDVLQHADRALYAAKAAGKARWQLYDADAELRALPVVRIGAGPPDEPTLSVPPPRNGAYTTSVRGG